jgi:proliferating cell nuclear antigen
MRIAPAGISITTVDPANTAMVCIELMTIAFVNYDATECEIGIDVEAFKKIIDVADDSDLITLETSMDMKELVVEFGPFLYVMALLTNVRNPGHPSFSRAWTTSVCIPGHRFKQMVKAVEVVNDYASIGVEDNGEFFMDAVDGDHVKQVSAVLRNMCTKTPQKKTQSLYSLDYLQGLAEAVPAEGTVVLHIGDDVPLLAEFVCCDGGKVRYVLAPRIESD